MWPHIWFLTGNWVSFLFVYMTRRFLCSNVQSRSRVDSGKMGLDHLFSQKARAKRDCIYSEEFLQNCELLCWRMPEKSSPLAYFSWLFICLNELKLKAAAFNRTVRRALNDDPICMPKPSVLNQPKLLASGPFVITTKPSVLCSCNTAQPLRANLICTPGSHLKN